MMDFADPSMTLLAASGGDTVKLFDVSVEPGDPCTLSYSPSPGHQVNSVKWNHTSWSLTLCFLSSSAILFWLPGKCRKTRDRVFECGEDNKNSTLPIWI